MIKNDRYRLKYTLQPGFYGTEHSYELIGAKGGVQFHLKDYGEKRDDTFIERYSSGIEIHYRIPPQYLADKSPSQDKCWLINCPCWHDGTSLYAKEHFEPYFDGVNHERIFRMLTSYADDVFKIEIDA